MCQGQGFGSEGRREAQSGLCFQDGKQTDTQTYRLSEGRGGASTAFVSLLKQCHPLWDSLLLGARWVG